jgi:hypothetical protein
MCSRDRALKVLARILEFLHHTIIIILIIIVIIIIIIIKNMSDAITFNF